MRSRTEGPRPTFVWLWAALLIVFPALGLQAQELPTSTSDSSVGYIDNAIVGNQLRLRFDAAFNADLPDRAEFFYAKCGCFRVAGADPKAPGPSELETNVDYQVLRADVEYAVSSWLSGFLEAPVRLLNPDRNDNTGGLGDVRAGVKVGLLACEHRSLTLQLRTYIPTGDADRGLGTHHVSLEPGLLFQLKCNDRLTVAGEIRDWIPLGGSSALPVSPGEFSGNVLRYGLGASYDLIDGCSFRFAPVAEFVGWTVLDGFATSFDGVNASVPDVGGDTIFNVKIGGRLTYSDKESLYVGYGRALTDEVWYEDILRVEFRRSF